MTAADLELTRFPQKELCELSRQYAPDVDGWITQARNLHKDIERSRLTAREIVAQHEKGQSLREEANQASTKLDELKGEIAFNREFTEALEAVRDLNTRIDTAKDDLQGGEIAPVIDNVEGIEAAIRNSKLPENSYVSGILSTKASELRRSISDHAHKYWNSLVRIDRRAHKLAIESGKLSGILTWISGSNGGIQIHLPDLKRLSQRWAGSSCLMPLSVPLKRICTLRSSARSSIQVIPEAETRF